MKQSLFKFIFSSPFRAIAFLASTITLLGARICLYWYVKNAPEVSLWRLVWVELLALFVFLLTFVIMYGAYVRVYGIPRRK